MGKFCPKCGAEVKEGFKFCLGCGAPLQEQATAPQAPPPAQPVAPAAPPQQSVHPGYQPMQPKQTNMKLIFGIIGIVVAIVVIILVVFLVLGMGGGGGAEDFVGAWNAEAFGGLAESQWEFGEGNTLTITTDYGYGEPYVEEGTYSINGNKIDFEGITSLDYLTDLTFEFSNGGNTVTLNYTVMGQEYPYYTLTKVTT